jgi:cell division protein FtsB
VGKILGQGEQLFLIQTHAQATTPVRAENKPSPGIFHNFQQLCLAFCRKNFILCSVNILQSLTKMVTLIVVVVLVGALLIGFVPQYQKHLAHEKRLQDLRAQKERENARLQDLRVRQERFQADRDYVRKVAHEMGMVEPHEMIFRFQDDSGRNARSGQ